MPLLQFVRYTGPNAEQEERGMCPLSVSIGEEEVIAQEAYIYLYPLILMDLTRKQLINLDPKLSPYGGPAKPTVVAKNPHYTH